MGKYEIEQYFTYLAVTQKISPTTQNLGGFEVYILL